MLSRYACNASIIAVNSGQAGPGRKTSHVTRHRQVYGFTARNGRTQADNAPEAMLSLVTNTAVPSGLTPATTKDQRAASFPYVVSA
jgi:hypothetical protein